VAPGEQDDRLEEAGLAGGIGTPQELGPWPELDVERGVAAEIGQPDGRERGGL
jgi:hypothetical protein